MGILSLAKTTILLMATLPQIPAFLLMALLHSNHKHNPPPYVPAREGDQRSPCPGVNTLANHGYLPRNGRRITALHFLNALHCGLNVSVPFALLLVVYTYIRFGHLPLVLPYSNALTTLDLHELARHNILEHDASMGHADARSEDGYAPTTPDAELIEALVRASSDGKTVAVEDAARIRVIRQELAKERRGHGLGSIQEFVAQGEWGLLMGLLGEGRKYKESVETEKVRKWLTEERLPGDRVPLRVIGFVDAQLRALSMRAAMKANEIRRDVE